MVENVDIPKGFLVFLEAPWPQNAGNHKKSGFYGEIQGFSDSPLFYIKNLKICGFHFLGCSGPPKPPIILEDYW